MKMHILTVMGLILVILGAVVLAQPQSLPQTVVTAKINPPPSISSTPICIWGGSYPNCNSPPNFNSTIPSACAYGGSYPNCNPAPACPPTGGAYPQCGPSPLPAGQSCYANATRPAATSSGIIISPGSGIPQPVQTANVGATVPPQGSGYCGIAQWDPTLKSWDMAAIWLPSLGGAQIFANGFYTISGWYTIIVNDQNKVIQSYGTAPAGFTPGSLIPIPSTIIGVSSGWVLIAAGSLMLATGFISAPRGRK